MTNRMKQYAMTVKELINKLEKLNPDLPVMLMQDAEGNGFELARGVEFVVVTEPNDRDFGSVINHNTKDDTSYEYGIDEEDWQRMQSDPEHLALLIYP